MQELKFITVKADLNYRNIDNRITIERLEKFVLAENLNRLTPHLTFNSLGQFDRINQILFISMSFQDVTMEVKCKILSMKCLM